MDLVDGLDGQRKSRPHRHRVPDFATRSEFLHQLSYPDLSVLYLPWEYFLGEINVKLGIEDTFKPKIGNESYMKICVMIVAK